MRTDAEVLGACWLRVGRWFDVENGQTHGESVITMRDGLIADICSYREWSRREEALGVADSVVDCRDLVALPGMIDCHVHVTGLSVVDVYPDLKDTPYETAVERNPISLSMSDGMRLLAGVRNLKLALSAGITTVRDCGGRGELPFWLRDGLEVGLIDGPRMLVAGPIVTPTGGHGNYGGGEADGPSEIRKMVRGLTKKGVDFIKTAATGGLATGTTNPGLRSFSTEELTVLVEEAHRNGRKVSAHILGRLGIELSLEAGVDIFEHVWFMEPDRSMSYDHSLVERMAQAGVTCCPTPATEHRLVEMIEEKQLRGMATRKELELATWSKTRVEQNLEIVMKMKSEGIPLIHGTDAGVSYIPFNDYALGLELMVSVGMSTEYALAMATINPARALGLNAGSLRIGARADLCLTGNNPADDITNLRDVRRVFMGGRCVYSS